MKLTNRKTILGILIAFILISILLIIFLFGKSEKTEETNNTANITSVKENKESPVIYGEVSEDDLAVQEQEFDENKSSYALEGTTDTVFDSNKDITNLKSYSLTSPIIIENSNFPGMSREIFANYKGYVFAYTNNNEILYYDPNNRETYSLTNEVTRVFPSFNVPYILFEKKTEKGYTLYRFDFIKNKNGFEDIVSLSSSAVDFGQHKEFNYYAVQEQPNTFYYQSIKGSSFEAEQIGFRDFSSNVVEPYRDYLVSYLKSDNALYKVEFGKSPEKLFELPNYTDLKYLVHFKVNPFRTDRLIYIASYSDIEDDLSGKKVISNGTTVPELLNITNVEWVSSESIVYTDDSPNGELYLFNLETKEKYVLATNVATFGFNSEEKAIYYIQSGRDELKKISFTTK